MTRMRITALVLAAGVLLGAVPAGLNSTEQYLAYRVRLERGDSGYAMTALLDRIARARAYEIVTNKTHVFTTYWRLGLRCTAAEILGWSVIADGRDAVRWVIRHWNLSASHRPFLDNVDRRWRHYGVGAIRSRGYWYMVVAFSEC